ncbi:hypothetical protein FBU59_003126 [Linderina macrospora]|uniref:Uncharacterized protein n=1 Tax=Linderina macrospora TaxID=4868 RepID=A0ACC1J971_9FUNG|nr:hypothetical protein FBU59_003126 [Linderina macrospora]
MFKKPFNVKSRTPVRSSDCRRVAKEAKNEFSNAWEAVENTQGSDVVLPVPSNLQTAKFVSHVGEKGQIFYDGPGDPLWIKAELLDSQEPVLVPTVYTLWRFPAMLPVLWTWPAVVKKLIGGADLMAPGLIIPDGGLPDLKRGAVVAICCPGSLAAQAVGVLTFDTKGVTSVAGAKGKAVLITHTYKDHLWESGSKAHPPEILQAGSDAALHIEGDVNGSGEDDDDGGEWTVVSQKQPSDRGATAAAASEGSDASQNDDGAQLASRLESVAAISETTAAAASEPPTEPSPAEMDTLLLEALKQVMATVLSEKAAAALLPLNSSTLYSSYIVSNAPHNQELDIKKSTFKKLAKFLKAAEKRGLVQLKDIRGESHIKSFNWKHKEMVEYKPYKVSSAKKDRGPADSAATDASASQQAASQAGNSAGGMIRIVELFKPSNALKPLFDDVGASAPSGYFNRQQARQVLEDYIKARGLIDPKSPRQVKLDHRLCDGLLTKEEYSKLTVFPRDKLQSRLQEKMTLYTELHIPGKMPTAKIGAPPQIDILCEKKMGNKVITRTVGLEKYDIDPHVVAKELRTICASSTTVDPVPGKKNALAVMVQGHHVGAVTKLLEKHGLPSRLIGVTDKTGKPKKK